MSRPASATLSLTAISLVVALALLLSGAWESEAQTSETVCDIDRGTSRFGLCYAYCEAMDCDSGFPQASDAACERVFVNYFLKSGGLEPPCVEF